MSGVTARLDRLIIRQPTLIREPIRSIDLTQLTNAQRSGYDRLNARCRDEGATGLTVEEMYECAALVALIHSQQPK